MIIIMMIGRPEQSQVLSHVQWVVTALWSSDQRDWRPVQSSSTRRTFVIMSRRLTTHMLTCTFSPPHSCLPSSVTPAQSLLHLYCEYRHQVQFNSVPAGFGTSGVSWIISRCSHNNTWQTMYKLSERFIHLVRCAESCNWLRTYKPLRLSSDNLLQQIVYDGKLFGLLFCKVISLGPRTFYKLKASVNNRG